MGIAQIAITPPPPHSNGHSGALFFRRDFTILPFLPFCLPFSLNKCPKPSGQGFRPPQNQANARLNLENSSLKKCPKPSGQGFRPPPQTGNAQIEVETSWKGLPLGADDLREKRSSASGSKLSEEDEFFSPPRIGTAPAHVAHKAASLQSGGSGRERDSRRMQGDARDEGLGWLGLQGLPHPHPPHSDHQVLLDNHLLKL